MVIRKLFTQFSNNDDEHTRTDSDIIKRVAAGDFDAYEIIMRRYNQQLFRVARSILLDDGHAMDAVQEAHIKAYRSLASFSGDLGFRAWIMKIAKNEALMARRKLKPDTMVTIDTQGLDDIHELNMASTENTPEAVVANDQLRSQLSAQIDTLPEDFRTVFVMRGVEQLSTRETAQILELNETTVKTRFFRAKALLQKQILRDYGTSIYEVGGHHCDQIVGYVMAEIRERKKRV